MGPLETHWFADRIDLNAADNFLHLALAVVLLGVGFALGES